VQNPAPKNLAGVFLSWSVHSKVAEGIFQGLATWAGLVDLLVFCILRCILTGGSLSLKGYDIFVRGRDTYRRVRNRLPARVPRKGARKYKSVGCRNISRDTCAKSRYSRWYEIPCEHSRMWREVYPQASMSVATVSPRIIHRTTRASATTISAMQMADGRWKMEDSWGWRSEEPHSAVRTPASILMHPFYLSIPCHRVEAEVEPKLTGCMQYPGGFPRMQQP
jgi:hypothetical protein